MARAAYPRAQNHVSMKNAEKRLGRAKGKDENLNARNHYSTILPSPRSSALHALLKGGGLWTP